MIHHEIDDEKVLKYLGVYTTTHDLYNYTMPYDEALVFFGITKTVANRVSLGQYSKFHDGQQLFCPILAARGIHRILVKRKQTLQEYMAYAINQNRAKSNPLRYGGATTTSLQSSRTLNKVINLIHTLTLDQPKARAVFERELRKINVYLPKLE